MTVYIIINCGIKHKFVLKIHNHLTTLKKKNLSVRDNYLL